MSAAATEATIRVKVDPTNPGQFFACCGLLEVGFRLDGECCGRFMDDKFELIGAALPPSADELIDCLLKLPELAPEITKKAATGGSKSKLIPLVLTFGEERLRLDWWRDESKPPSKLQINETCASSQFKTWTANQSPQQIVYERLLPALRELLKARRTDLFAARTVLTGRFGFDPVAASVPLDVGWSPDKHDVPVATSPAVELLAAIGLQRFKPREHPTLRRTFLYSAWSEFLPPDIAAAACAGAAIGVSGQYQFSLGERGDYKFFEHATPVGVVR